MMTLDLDVLAGKWATVLRSEGKALNTVRSRTGSIRAFAAWQQARGGTGLDRESACAFIASILDSGGAATTAAVRVRALRIFAAWLAAEGVIDCNPLAGLKSPRPGKRIVPSLSAGEVDALLATCADPGFASCRDQALILFMAGTGPRASEVLDMTLPADLDTDRRLAWFRKTKGKQERSVPFSATVAASISRYLHARQARGLPAGNGPLWISRNGQQLSYDGLYRSLNRRAAIAGISGFHPHRFRHTFAVNWLEDGGSEAGLMKLGGWTSREMIDLYTADRAADLAIAEARRIMR